MSDVLEKIAAAWGRPLTEAERSFYLGLLPPPRKRKNEKITVSEMRAHIEYLCRRHDVSDLRPTYEGSRCICY